VRAPWNFPVARFRVLTEAQWRQVCLLTGADPTIDLLEVEEVQGYAARIRAQHQHDWMLANFWLLDYEGQPTEDLHNAHWYDKRDHPTLKSAQDALELERRRRDDLRQPTPRRRRRPRA
jgi:hypothetical protein